MTTIAFGAFMARLLRSSASKASGSWEAFNGGSLTGLVNSKFSEKRGQNPPGKIRPFQG